MKKIVCIASMLFLSVLLPAYADGVIASFGYGQSDQIKGGQLEFGYRKKFDSTHFNLIPLSIIANNERKPGEQTTITSDEAECRDSTTGKFLYPGPCDGKAQLRAVLSADFALTEHVVIGAGIRVGPQVELFSNVRYRINENLNVDLRYGKKYASLGFGFEF